MPQVRPLFFRDAQLLEGDVCDVRLADGVIVAMAAGLQPQHGDEIIEAHGNLLLPGLHDHHLHLFASAAARASIPCGPPSVNNEEQLSSAIATAPGTGWLRGVGFHDSVCATLDRHWLDQVCADRPLRIQHRSGMMWILNSCAVQLLTLDNSQALPEGVERDSSGKLTGRFYNLDAWLGQHLKRAWPSLDHLSAELACYGITAVTDTGVNNDADVWQALEAAAACGELMQRVLVMGSEALNDITPPAPERMDVGPLKLYLREIDLPELDSFAARIAKAHERDRAVAIHCVTRVELIFALEAIAQAGVLPGDRIEHASIADNDALARMAELGVCAVTQPHFIAERGDQYLNDVDAEDLPWLYRGAGFLSQGAALAAGSDAPYGATDPWAAMRSAVERKTREGVVMAGSESLTPRQALGLFGGTAAKPGGGLRGLKVGDRADLCLMDTDWNHLSRDLCAGHVALTICAGEFIYQSPSIQTFQFTQDQL